MIGQTISRYRILEFLGSGSSGSVYRAEDLKRHRLVAIKVLYSDGDRSPDFAERLNEELGIVELVDHPGVPRIYERGTADSFRYVVMQIADGDSVESRMRQGPVPLTWAVRVIAEATEALHEAHDNNLLHRHLKPSNLHAGSSVVRISGFGMHPHPSDAERRIMAASKERRPYLSPEQLSGEAPDARSDIYALGVILYQLVTGRLPFNGENSAEIRRSILEDHPETPSVLRPGTPASLDRAILASLSRRPEDRPQTARDFLAGLYEAGRDLNLLTLAHAPLARRRRRHFGTWMPMASAVLVLVIIWLLWKAVRHTL